MARARTEKNRQYEGKSIAQIARMRGEEDPMDTCITLMAEEGGSISGIFHTMSEQDVRTVMKLPWVSIASDGSAINLDAPGVPHPRNYSTNVRVFGHYVRDTKVLTLPEAVRKMTTLPASILGLKDRGQIKEGLAADIAVFDAAKAGETNSFDKPKSYAVGVPYVLVNGVVVIDKGSTRAPGPASRCAVPARPARSRVRLPTSASPRHSAPAFVAKDAPRLGGRKSPDDRRRARSARPFQARVRSRRASNVSTRSRP